MTDPNNPWIKPCRIVGPHFSGTAEAALEIIRDIRAKATSALITPTGTSIWAGDPKSQPEMLGMWGKRGNAITFAADEMMFCLFGWTIMPQWPWDWFNTGDDPLAAFHRFAAIFENYLAAAGDPASLLSDEERVKIEKDLETYATAHSDHPSLSADAGASAWNPTPWSPLTLTPYQLTANGMYMPFKNAADDRDIARWPHPPVVVIVDDTNSGDAIQIMPLLGYVRPPIGPLDIFRAIGDLDEVFARPPVGGTEHETP